MEERLWTSLSSSRTGYSWNISFTCCASPKRTPKLEQTDWVDIIYRHKRLIYRSR